MRLDKFLKNSRIIKRRSVAKDACEKGRVLINGKQAKAGTEVNLGDEIQIEFGQSKVLVQVTKILDSQKKEDAETMYKVLDR